MYISAFILSSRLRIYVRYFFDVVRNQFSNSNTEYRLESIKRRSKVYDMSREHGLNFEQ